MFRKLLKKTVCYSLRLAHHTMHRLRYEKINHTITRVTFGHLVVSSTRWLLLIRPLQPQIWINSFRLYFQEIIKRYPLTIKKISVKFKILLCKWIRRNGQAATKFLVCRLSFLSLIKIRIYGKNSRNKQPIVMRITFLLEKIS
jgi:hypothetical protein